MASTSLRMVIASSEPIYCNALKELFGEHFPVIETVASAKSLRESAATPADIFIIDANLEGGNGFDQVAHLCLEKPSPRPRILMICETCMAPKAIDRGAVGTINPPIGGQNAAILRMVQSHVMGREPATI